MMLSVFVSSTVDGAACFPKKRTDLYHIAVGIMLAQADKKAAKVNMGTGGSEQNVGGCGKELLLRLLQKLAWTCQTLCTKNLSSDVVVAAKLSESEQRLWNFVQQQVKIGKLPLLVCLQESIDDSKQAGSNDSHAASEVYRFAHLTFQEYL